MSTIIQRIREEVSSRRSTGSLLPAYQRIYGEPKAVTFSDVMTAYTRDPSCKAFVDFLADQAVGMGFYTTVNEEYEYAEEAKQAVDEFNESVNLDGLLQIGAREIVASGNSFWLKTEPERLENLKVLPLTGFDNPKAVVRDQYGEITGYNYAFGDVKKSFAPEKIIHFRWNPVNFSAFGTGVLQKSREELSDKKPGEVLLCPSKIDGVDFLKKHNAWGFIRMSKSRAPRYLALYVGKPESSVLYFGDVESITQPLKSRQDLKKIEEEDLETFETGKRVIHLKSGSLVKFKDPIPLKDRKAAPRGPIYTTLKKLIQANYVNDLLKRS